MEIQVLGSGTCVPSLVRSSCAVVVSTDDATILLDIGAGTIRRLTEASIPIDRISHIGLSHFHPDHTGELASFLFSSKYPAMRRTKESPLLLAGGNGLKDFFNSLNTTYRNWLSLPDAVFSMIELPDNGSIMTDKTRIETTPVNHNPESIAYRIESGGRSMVYSGDTDYCSSLVSLADRADLFICEAALPDAMKVDNHLTPSLAGRIASEAAVKKLVLTHFYPECDKTDIAKECRRTYDGELILAEDLMRIRV